MIKETLNEAADIRELQRDLLEEHLLGAQHQRVDLVMDLQQLLRRRSAVG